jgi:energy-coupling factor transporter transmembrane protein EcfT
MMMEKRIEKMEFRKRFLRRMINWLIFFIVLPIYVFVHTQYYFFLIFALFVICINLFISYKESINYIEIIEMDSEMVRISISSNINFLSTFEYRISEIDIEYIGNGIGLSSISSPRVVFKKGGKIFLKQFSVGFWDSKHMIEIEKAFRQKKPFKSLSQVKN